MEPKERTLDTEGVERRTFFAASNSARGFVSYYPTLFGASSGVDHLYIVKGGPGTGKSHFMHVVAGYAAARGWEGVFYRCSSDPASLDGVRLSKNGKTVGLLDGTAPHAWEASLPGTREDLVDLGQFWDSRTLSGRREEICALGARKAAAYRQAYHYLSGCGAADQVLDDLIAPFVNEERLELLAGRILRGQAAEARRRREGTGETGGAGAGEDVWPVGLREMPALRRAIGMTGRVRLNGFASGAERVLCVGDRFGMGYRLLDHLRDISARRGWPVLVSFDPVRPEKVDGLFWPESRLCVLNDALPEEPVPSTVQLRALPLRRYMDVSSLRTLRPDVREAVVLGRELSDGACHALARASDAHFALEKIYTETMDFPAKEAFTEAFCRRVFGK